MEFVKCRSVVKVWGTCRDGTTAIQEYTLEHDPGAPDDALLGQVLGEVRKMGGLTVKGAEGKLVYYPGHQFERLELTVSRVTLASAVTLN